MFLSIPQGLVLLKFEKRDIILIVGLLLFMVGLDAFHGSYLCCNHCDYHVFGNQSVCGKEKTNDSERCR